MLAFAAVAAFPAQEVAQIAAAAHRHAECPVAEAFDSEGLAARTAHVLALHGVGNVGDVVETQFAREDDDVRELRVKAKGPEVRDAQLRREMHGKPERTGALDHGRVRRDDGGNARLGRSVEHAVHELEFLLIDDAVEREIGFGAGVAAT